MKRSASCNLHLHKNMFMVVSEEWLRLLNKFKNHTETLYISILLSNPSGIIRVIETTKSYFLPKLKRLHAHNYPIHSVSTAQHPSSQICCPLSDQPNSLVKERSRRSVRLPISQLHQWGCLIVVCMKQLVYLDVAMERLVKYEIVKFWTKLLKLTL